MKHFLKKFQKVLFPGAVLLILFGAGLLWLGLRQSLTVIVNGEAETVHSPAISVSGVLRDAGIVPDDADRVIPSRDRLFWDRAAVNVQTARQIIIKTPQEEIVLETAERIPANLLEEAGITLFPKDQVLVNGTAVDPNDALRGEDPVLLQYKPAKTITLEIDGSQTTFYTDQPTLGAALEDEKIFLAPQDWISDPLASAVTGSMRVTIRRARPITVSMGETALTGWSSAVTVGDALQDLGVPLQNLDYSKPADEKPLPENGEIKIVRVSEDVLIMTDEVAYQNEYVEDPDTLLDTTSVIEPGQVGIFATRERIRYENGQETWRSTQDRWQASEAQDGVIGYGTQVEIRTEVVGGVEIEYWRKIAVYATAYSPCRSGTDQCHYGTATGIMPVQQGVVAVTPRWLSVPNGYGMWGQPVYIPGYGRGVIADVGGGIPGTPWIDLAYSDDNYVSWNRWTVMYFLTPVPAWYPAFILP